MFTNSRFAFSVNRILARLRGDDISPPLESQELDTLKEENLLLAQKVFDELGIPVFLFAGTLLGWFRDRKLISHDPDVDFGLPLEAFETLLIHDPALESLHGALSREGFIQQRSLGDLSRMKELGYELSYLRKGSAVDLFILVPDESRQGWSWNSVWFKKGWKRWKRHMRKQYHPWVGTTDIEFLGNRFRVPMNTEDFILNHYGPGWRTPVKNWDYLHSPSNIDTMD